MLHLDLWQAWPIGLMAVLMIADAVVCGLDIYVRRRADKAVAEMRALHAEFDDRQARRVAEINAAIARMALARDRCEAAAADLRACIDGRS
jgi:hypothetical protein